MSMANSQDEIKGKSLVEMAEELEAEIRESARQGRSLHEVEKDSFRRVLQMGHAAINQLLVLQGDGDLGESVVTADGQRLKRSEQPVERPLRTVFGEHTIRAYVYAAGAHQAIALRPVDARLSLPAGRCSYFFEEFSQYFCVDQAFEQASEGLAMVLRQEVSVDTLERLNRRMGEQAEGFLDRLPTPPAQQEGELLVFTADGKGVPLVKADARRVPAFDKAERPGNRRMATLAAVYTIAPYLRTPEQIVAALFRDDSGPRPKDRPQPQFKHVTARFTRMREDPDGEVWESNGAIEAFVWADEQIRARRRPGQKLLRLMDGQASLWEAASNCLSVPPEDTIEILDILHVSSYVWRAAKVFYPHREQQEAFARDRLLRILQGEVHGVVAGLRQMATKRQLKGKRREEIATVCGYFEKHAGRMRYDEYLAAGYPIATGVIEGACRHLVKDRMERSGMRWRLIGAQAMLHVRAVYQSSYWDRFHADRITREQSTLHPHRALLGDYHPLALAG
ncbi:MAG: ISKra4 family transposase [Alphaproteobacteria bacterium]